MDRYRTEKCIGKTESGIKLRYVLWSEIELIDEEEDIFENAAEPVDVGTYDTLEEAEAAQEEFIGALERVAILEKNLAEAQHLIRILTNNPEANRDYRQSLEGTAVWHCKACAKLVKSGQNYCDTCQELKDENVRDDAERED